jgi:periplasmic mercuric ion binding protein
MIQNFIKLFKMKRINQFVVVFSFLGIILASCGSEANYENPPVEETGIEILSENVVAVDYAVEGMVCAMGCANTIQEELSDMAGIASCEVDFETGKAHVEFDKTQISENDITSKIESLADGQYKASEWIEKEVEEDAIVEEEGNSDEEETIAELSLPSFEIPNLFTFLLGQI